MTSLMVGSKGRVLLWSAAFVLLWTAPTHADFSSTVVSVLDGDTIEVLNGHHTARVRLSGIDCPEKVQAFGKQAKYAASDLAFGTHTRLRQVQAYPWRRDPAGWHQGQSHVD